MLGCFYTKLVYTKGLSMTRKTEETEIYKHAINSTDIVMDIVKNMDNKFKNVIGDRLMEMSLDLLNLVIDSHKRNDKMEYLNDILINISKSSTLIRLTKEKRLCSPTAYARFVEELMEIEEQTKSWVSYIKSRNKV